MAYQILIIDDDSDFRAELKDCLSDYKIIEAANGEEALKLIKKPNAIDMVLLDVIMSGLSGIDVLKEMKAIRPELAVIIITGKSSKDIAIEALKGHADDYIEKPFKIEQLLSTIEKVLKGQHANHPNQGDGIKAKIEQAKYFIDRNFDKKISLEDVAEQVCLSPKYFSRVFKEVAGVGFNEYRLKVKTLQAANLLKTTEYTISQLSHELGYKNTESFIRIFKSIMKCTPTEYRNSPKNAPTQSRKKSIKG